MGKVLKCGGPSGSGFVTYNIPSTPFSVLGTSAPSWVEMDLGSAESDIWVAVDVRMDAAALSGTDHLIELYDAAHSLVDSVTIADVAGSMTADTFSTIAVHHDSGGGTRDLYVDGVLVSSTGTSGDCQYQRLGAILGTAGGMLHMKRPYASRSMSFGFPDAFWSAISLAVGGFFTSSIGTITADHEPKYEDVWLTWDVRLTADAIAFWTGPGSGNYVKLSELGDGDQENVWLGDHPTELPFLWNGGPAAVGTEGSNSPSADTGRHTFESHYHDGVVAELFIDGAAVWSTVPDGSGDVTQFSLGLVPGTTGDAETLIYLDNVLLGTTRGASDLFADGFESGDLSAWTTTSGDVSVVDDPFPSALGPVPRCSYVVESAWGQETSGLFRFGISRFGGSDVLAASSWSAIFDGPYDDLTAIARTIAIQRGRDNDVTQFRAGQLDLSMRDAAGIYNPFNSASPLVIGGGLDTDKPIRVAAVIDAVTYPLIYAFITDIEGDPSGRGTVQITAVDFLDKLDRLNPILTGLSGGLTDGQLIGMILDWYQWQDPAMRNLAVGDTINAAYTRANGTRSGLVLVGELMEAERGLAFVAASGAVTYIDRNIRYGVTSLATINKTLKAFPAGKSNSNVTNTWTVQRTDMAGNPLGAPQTARDDASDRAHGTIAQTITTPFLNTDAQALSLAQYLVRRTKSGVSLVYDVPLSITDKATLIQAVSRDIGDRVTLTIDPLNMPTQTGDFYIEATAHTISTAPGTARHQTTWRVSECPVGNAFRFGVSKFGGGDWLAY